MEQTFKFRRNGWLLAAVVGEIILVTPLIAVGETPLPTKYLPWVFLAQIYWLCTITMVIFYHRRYKNMVLGRENNRALAGLIAAQSPFALYLRDFHTEANIGDTLPMSPYLPPRFGVADAESNVLEPIAKHLPVFALANERDMNVIRVARRLAYIELEWYDEFERLAAEAALIVIKAHDLSSGIERELEWIAREDYFHKTFLVASPDVLEHVDRHMAGGKSGPKWMMVEGARPQVPASLLSYLEQVVMT